MVRELRDMGLDAVIIDPALIVICATEAPGLEIHLSTQASSTNYESFEFLEGVGPDSGGLGSGSDHGRIGRNSQADQCRN